MSQRNETIRLAAQRLGRRRGTVDKPEGTFPLWDAAFFNLDHVERFRSAAPTAQRDMLESCARGVLAEAWRIEQCGIQYCARMTLQAESEDEQRLFSLIGADEALHASWLAPWIEQFAPEPDPFNRFIAGLAEAGRPQPMIYILQVVLEGFGITHYNALSSQCQDATLSSLLRQLAEDEALHHAGGLAAFRSDRFSQSDREFCAEAATTFLHMIRCGPQRAVHAVDRAIGVRDQGDAARLFEALDAQADSAMKLSRLRALMTQPGMEWLIDRLDRGGVFEPCSPVDCAQIYAGIR